MSRSDRGMYQCVVKSDLSSNSGPSNDGSDIAEGESVMSGDAFATMAQGEAMLLLGGKEDHFLKPLLY